MKKCLRMRNDGATVTDLGDGVYTLTKKVVKSNETITVTVTVDKSIGRIVGNAIYDNTGKPKYMVIYSYHSGANPIVKNVIQRSYKTTRNGIALVTEKTTQFHKLEIIGTIPSDKGSNSGLY
ncbi:MAG: hypothetical protein U5L45_22370 [Saprospiraceae bacterium]|nr:hypothetical protein [Saprospiraceae bacterium]